MRKLKIIYVNRRTYGRSFASRDSDDFYLFGVGHLLGEQLLKRNNGILVENWRTDKAVKEITTRVISGIKCKIFPSLQFWRYGEYSMPFLNELMKEKKDSCFIIHFMGTHDLFYDFVGIYFRKYPIVATHLGGANPYFKFKKNRKIASLLFGELEQRIFLRFHDHIFVTTKPAQDYFQKALTSGRVSKCPIYGFDFEVFKRVPKKIARRKLNLPLDSKIMLSVSRAYINKGIGFVLNAFSILKGEGILLLMVDVQQKDSLYDKVVASGALHIGHVDYFSLPIYYSAADLLVYLPFDDDSLNFGGTSYVPLESLACGTPVVSTLLRHFPDPAIHRVARIPESPSDVVPMVKDILRNPPLPDDCRKLVYKYFNWDNVMRRHIDIYRDLFQRYYNRNVNSL